MRVWIETCPHQRKRLSKLTSAKAQITIAEHKDQEYLQYQRQNNLLLGKQTDEQLIKLRKKLNGIKHLN